MSNLFSRKSNRCALQQALSRTLNIIPEEDETRSSSSSSSSPCASPIRPESYFNGPNPTTTTKRTFSTSHIEVSFADDEGDVDELYDHHNSLSDPRPAPSPPVTPPRLGARATSPTPSTSSSSSSVGLPSTPTSSDDEFQFPTPLFNPRRASIKPLNLGYSFKTSPPAPTEGEAEEEEEESDGEWYAREFEKILSWSSRAAFPAHEQNTFSQSRPESLLIEPVLADVVRAASMGTNVTPSLPNNLKRATTDASRTHKRNRSAPKEPPPPVPPIPAQFLRSTSPSTVAIPEIKITPEPSSPTTNPSAKAHRPRSLTLDLTPRPPPRTSVPDDCCTEAVDVVTGDENDDGAAGSWPSAFDLSSYEHPSPARPSSAFIPAAPLPDSPVSMYSQYSLRSHYPSAPILPSLNDTFDELDSFVDVEFALDDLAFDLSMDAPMQLPLSLPNSPVDFEGEFLQGLEDLRKSVAMTPGITVTDADEVAEEQEEQVKVAKERSLPPTPVTSTSFSSYYSPCTADVFPPSPFSSTMADEDSGSPRPVLRSKWSSSTLASVRSEHAAGASSALKFAAADKLRMYFKKQKHEKDAKEKKDKEHKRTGSAAAIAAAKAAVARAKPGAVVYHPSSALPFQPSATPSAVKKAQRQVVLVPPSYPYAPHAAYFYPRAPSTPSTPNSVSYASPPYSPSPSPKSKPRWSARRDSDVMIIGYGHNGVGQEQGLKRKGSLTPTVSDAGSEESCSSCASSASTGLRRKPIPVEMFLRSAVNT